MRDVWSAEFLAFGQLVAPPRLIVKRLADALPDLFAACRVGARQQEDELLAAVPGGEIGGPLSLPGNEPGDRNQAFVASLMTVLVVVSLEMIDIDQQQRQCCAVSAGTCPLIPQFLVEVAPVGEASQPVQARQGRELVFL